MEMRPMNGGSLKAAGYDERTRKLVIELTLTKRAESQARKLTIQ